MKKKKKNNTSVVQWPAVMDSRWKKKEQRLMQMETKEEEWVSNKEEVYI